MSFYIKVGVTTLQYIFGQAYLAQGDHTILPLDSSLSSIMGQRTQISFYDTKLVNTAYYSGTGCLLIETLFSY